MKRSLKLFVFCFAIAAVTSNYGCSSSTNPPGGDKNNPLPISSLDKQVETANNSFGLTLFGKIASQEEGKNFFISSLSVSMALAMTLNGAHGQTYTDMQKTLGLDGFTNDQINQSYQNLITFFSNLDPSVKFNIANSIWYRNTFSVLSDFLAVDSTYFDSEVRPLDFNDPGAAGTINSWVSDKTNGKISSVLQPPIDPSTMMYLINALYFNGMWKYSFDAANSNLYPFQLSNGLTESDSMMVLRDTLNYYSDTSLQVVELPYGDGDYSMLVLLPAANLSLTNAAAEFNQNEMDNITKNLTPRDVQLTLPKFKVKYETDLVKTLSQMGMGSAFSMNADFTRINPQGGLSITGVLHKTYVDVNEKGTEAAAVTVVTVGTTVAGPKPGPIFFAVIRPFMFLIKENHDNTIMFMGAIAQPSAASTN